MGAEGPRQRSYFQVNMDTDNNFTSGYCSGTGGYFPWMCGIDLSFEIEFFEGHFNTGHVILHAMHNDEEREAAQLDQRAGLVGLSTSIVSYRYYTEWVYYGPGRPPPFDEAHRCSESFEGRTEGPYVLPNGATICFVSDMCDGPFQGDFQYAFNPGRTELEMSIPYAAFLRVKNSSIPEIPALGLGSTVTAQFSLETSEPQWNSDATVPFAYHFG